MITEGTLHMTVNQNGKQAFKSAQLKCPIGTFKVSYSEVNTLKTGSYPGYFDISRIAPSYRMDDGRCYVELEAIVTQMALIQPAEKKLDTQAAPEIAITNHKLDLFERCQRPLLETKEDNAEDVELFGTLWPLGDEVRLDPTRPRPELRAQTERLEQLGYVFQSIDQKWTKQDLEAAA